MLIACLGCVTGRAVVSPEEGGATAEGPVERAGLFRGDKFRYDRMDVPWRALHDVVAIPAGAGDWTASDWSQLALWSGGIGSLMIRAPRSADSLLDGWLRDELDPRLPTVWTVPMQATLWSGIAVAGFGTWWWAARTDRPGLAQGLSLMGESLAVAQAYHASIKLTLGREGPRPDGAEPRIHGPGVGFLLYPTGAPSGHAATLYSLLSSGLAYFDPPLWLQITGHVVVGGLVTFHAIDHRHYASDLLWGGAMGWYVGQWVVNNRAARPETGEGRAKPGARAAIVPVPLPGGAGAAVVVGY
jgi:hypothetical protein